MRSVVMMMTSGMRRYETGGWIDGDAVFCQLVVRLCARSNVIASVEVAINAKL